MRRVVVSLAVALLLVAVAGAGAAAAGAAAHGACFGAAARDGAHPCTNTARTPSPQPGDPALYPSTFDCRTTQRGTAPVCRFGVPASRARATVALVGDSHAQHWRAALEVVAGARRWRGFSLTIATCPFSAAVADMPRISRRACVAWYGAVRVWFRRHPEVSTVFVSQKSDTPVLPSGGRSAPAIRRAGFVRAWSSLPRTVKRIVILRDVPNPADTTFDCLQAAVATGTPPLAVACPTPRAAALRSDPAATAAGTLSPARYRVIDLSSLFCTPGRCFPVIGGVQVYADIVGHVTAAYMQTVGPYLLRRLGG